MCLEGAFYKKLSANLFVLRFYWLSRKLTLNGLSVIIRYFFQMWNLEKKRFKRFVVAKVFPTELTQTVVDSVCNISLKEHCVPGHITQ